MNTLDSFLNFTLLENVPWWKWFKLQFFSLAASTLLGFVISEIEINNNRVRFQNFSYAYAINTWYLAKFLICMVKYT